MVAAGGGWGYVCGGGWDSAEWILLLAPQTTGCCLIQQHHHLESSVFPLLRVCRHVAAATALVFHLVRHVMQLNTPPPHV